MNNSTALLLIETKCYTACINKIYSNPPIEISSLDCISAGRLILCSLCAERTNTQLSISSNPSPFPSPVVNSAKKKKKSDPKKLKRHERTFANDALLEFGNQVWGEENQWEEHQFRPKESYFSTSLRISILDNLLMIASTDNLSTILIRHSWAFKDSQGDALYKLVSGLQKALLGKRITQKAKAKRKRVDSSEESEMEVDLDDTVDSVLASQPMRAPLTSTNVVNQPRPKAKRIRAPEQSMDEVMASMRPTRTRILINENNETGNDNRRSTRIRSKV